SPVAQYMTERGLHVTGVDSSPTLISLCRQRLPAQEWHVADMRSLKLARQFDGLLAWDSFFHLTPDDQRAMFAVFARHAAPSAILMFNSGPSHGEAIGEYRGDPLYHASLSAEEYRALIDGIGFEIVAHAVEDWQAGGGRTVWLTRARGRPIRMP
ncbi:MAG TPA: class I SAM-dependent methyltransferase, partial [Beijerinckiaceae bacterium]|nr:class I SAM-dependent methyltransferase [Beijerinckiaceae bacterium]